MWKFAVFAAVLAAIVAITAGPLSLTAGPPAYVVNTTADDPDLDVGVPGCDTGGGDCSLRAAIEQANDDGGGAITFDAGVFPTGAPATIAVDATGNGELPAIVVPLTIDGSGAGVVLEPAAGSMLDFGLFVLDDTPGDPTSFAITGNSFTIRGFEDTEANDDAEGDGIFICGDGGDGCGSGPLRDVTISGMKIEDVAGAAIRVDGGDDSDVTISGNDDLAGDADAAVQLDLGDDSSLDVIDGGDLSGDDGVNADFGDGADAGQTVAGHESRHARFPRLVYLAHVDQFHAGRPGWRRVRGQCGHARHRGDRVRDRDDVSQRAERQPVYFHHRGTREEQHPVNRLVVLHAD